ncbi:sodium:phosphate symporter [Clostridioides difficile]|uniref:Sodium/phosphate cotransporter n=4 Tax=Clostridioides difficile TaxID=1496 RepID=A0A9R0CEJ7_CLODR|nr:Na/Pi cotransporter family protein [Clostridioides difficile]OFU00241.1 sodium-dependent phosphate transporter [Clostridium sp. HMSC19E03]OFU13314.1 sodium-dependent phosphate transporter [Clostridium sp. HMSC19C09]OFU17345.1 sodium-dependent phosphate transporter [Clostridium sp. HMSC19C08]OFU24642.1 sodium-dependent phosphate transporter [Clostridium sp. HMSC19C05]OFU27095.1 sodium-dependent phosphate transporter [Clostridium sp. HMSC19B11]OFU30354.1 sodium-dependent phosphate transporte
MNIVISLIGGLGLFLYGMSLMGEGLQKSAGDKLKKIIELLTSNVVMGVLVGTVVTGIIQSSSATTVMVVGFVNAGIMNLSQAIGVIMGANIGTTVTAQLVSFNLEGIAPIALGIGILFYLFTSNQKTKHLSEILIGFGILFTGMEFMKDAVAPLAEYKAFTDALLYFSKNPVLGILAGFAITGIVQSSSASMGMLIALASQGILPLSSALPILYGDNIGTCVTSLLSSVGASRNARRAAVMHLSFNVIGTIIFMLVLNKPISAIVTHFDPTDTARQIANAHTLFNLTNVIILLPFSKYIVKLANRLIPIKETESEIVNNTKYLDERMFSTPSIALGNTVQEVVRMGHKATNSLEHSIAGFLNKSNEDINKAFESEKVVNKLQKDILNYLLKLSKEPLRDDERFRTDLLFNTVNDIERVSDHAENIAELAMSVKEMNISFSDSAIREIYEIYNKTITNFKDALIVLDVKDFELANKVLEVENEVNYLEKTFRNSHMIRLNNGNCTIDAGVLYLDLLTNLERISDHSTNIVKQVLKLKQKI